MALDAANKAQYTVFTPPMADEKRQGFEVDIYTSKTRGTIIRATANAILEVGVFVWNAQTDAMGGFAKLDKPTATGRNIIGLSIFSRAFNLDWNETLQCYRYKANSLMAIATEGAYFMYSEAPCDIGDKVWFRHTVDGANTRIGAIRNATGVGLDAHPTATILEKITSPGLVAVRL